MNDQARTTRRRVAYSTLALFAMVFALLSFRMMAGLDSSPETAVKSTNTSESAGDDQSSSVDSTTSAPTTRAS